MTPTCGRAAPGVGSDAAVEETRSVCWLAETAHDRGFVLGVTPSA